MIDVIKNRPLKIKTNGDTHPRLVAPFEQLEQIRTLFDANKIEYWVDDEVLSIDDGPEITFITLGYRSDPELAQRLLDSVP